MYAYTAAHLSWWMAIVALLPGAAFACLDTYYLRQERLFRELYNDAIKDDSEVPVFDMSTQRYCNSSQYPYCRLASVWKSNSVRVLHGMILLVGLILLVIAIVQRLSATEVADCIRSAL